MRSCFYKQLKTVQVYKIDNGDWKGSKCNINTYDVLSSFDTNKENLKNTGQPGQCLKNADNVMEGHVKYEVKLYPLAMTVAKLTYRQNA